MPIYRIALPAQVIFDVHATDEAAALATAYEVQQEYIDGWSLPGGLELAGKKLPDPGARCYVDSDAAAPTRDAIQNISEVADPEGHAYSDEEHAAIQEKYVGKTFTFYSPFEDHPGFEDGDAGTLVRLQRVGVDVEDANDLWVARGVAGEEYEVWGGEVYTSDTLIPLIEEHRFTNWEPRIEQQDKEKNA